MANNQKATRPSGPPKDEGWIEVGARGKPKKRSPTVSTVTPSPALRSSPRKDSPSATLSTPVKHTAPLKPVLSPPRTSTVSKPPPSKELSPSVGSPFKPVPVSPEKAVVRSDSVSSPSPSLPLAKPKVVPKPAPTTVESVVARRYPLGFKSEQEFRDLTRPIAQQARDGVVFVSGSSVTGKSFATGKTFGSHSDIDVGIASRRLREDSTQVQQTGKGKAFPAPRSPLDNARGRTKDRHPIGAKVFYGIPGERQVLIREHTPEGKRIK
ncbi:MAG: hypothetical protein JWN23_2954 [Rhodocyclales bacterium]|nr:hypothetical protein [Rhodocyclales bacterium]